ncbi:MAG: DUF4417 domain-containing protein [Spirochaetales bacterium]|nr:DUF4417 domain-containing protein [Spirochaetales bacterium]
MVLEQTDILFEINSIDRSIGSINYPDIEIKKDVFQEKHCCRNLADLMNIARILYSYLVDKGFKFTEKGYPIFDKEMFLDEWPDIVIPFGNRNSRFVKDKKKTVLCHFSKDKHIYPRLANLFSEIDIYRDYLGVISSDVTVTSDMDIEWQRFVILINELYLAVLAANGIKVILSTRCGSPETIQCFEGVPRGVMCASSFWGCEKKHSIEQTDYLAKILSIGASKLIIYGKHSEIIDLQLFNMGVELKCYSDYLDLCKRRIA